LGGRFELSVEDYQNKIIVLKINDIRIDPFFSDVLGNEIDNLYTAIYSSTRIPDPISPLSIVVNR